MAMNKSLSERLALSVRHDEKARQSFPDVIALRPEIEQALNDGWTRRQTWELLHTEGKIKCTYQWFVTLVNRHINNKHCNTSSQRKKNHRSSDNAGSSFSAQSENPGFSFESTFNKEELI